MHIWEIQEDAELLLEIRNENSELTVPITLLKVLKNGLFLSDVLYNEQKITFGAENVTYDLIMTTGNDYPLVWTDVQVKNVSLKGISGVLVASTAEATKRNRRSCYRVALGVNGIVAGVRVTVHDISVNGISFRAKEKLQFNSGEKVLITFAANYENYTVEATIVRIVEEENSFLYGCKQKPNTQIDQLISFEQRKQVQYKRKKI